MSQILKKSIKLRYVSMYDLYLTLVENPNPEAVIAAEKITGPILLIFGTAPDQILQRRPGQK